LNHGYYYAVGLFASTLIGAFISAHYGYLVSTTLLLFFTLDGQPFGLFSFHCPAKILTSSLCTDIQTGYTSNLNPSMGSFMFYYLCFYLR
jgi:hypothetical protein